MQQEELILTASRKKQVEDELNMLRTVRKPEITEMIRKAREYGDLSENFEYQEARRSQAFLNGRIADLEALLERAKIVDDDALNGDQVGLGSIVTVREVDTDEEWEFIIVDAVSADPLNDKISYLSPVGKALMKRKLGDTLPVNLPNGVVNYEIVGLRQE